MEHLQSSWCKKSDQPLKWKNYDGKKEYTTNASDVESLEFEHFPKHLKRYVLKSDSNVTWTSETRPLELWYAQWTEKCPTKIKDNDCKKKAETYSKTVLVYIFRSYIDPPCKGFREKKESKRNEKKQMIAMMQIPLNLDDVTTHKWQGVTKYLIVHKFTTGHTHMVGSKQFSRE